MKILIADDHPAIREGIIKIASEAKFIREIDEAENGSQTLEKIRNNKYDVVILDISLPDKNGLDILNEIMLFDKNIKVLILSVFEEGLFARKALNRGASGYLTKTEVPYDFINALLKIREGAIFVSDKSAGPLSESEIGNSDSEGITKLSNIELSVLRLAAAGKSTIDIAEEISADVKIVGKLKSEIMKKLNLKNTNEIVEYGKDNELL